MSTATTSSQRRSLRMTLISLLLGGGLGAAGWWYVEHAQWREVTDNAYIKGNLVAIASKIPGQVVKLAYDEGDQVAAGDIVARLAPGDAERALEEAKHMLGYAVREVLTRRAAVATAEAELELRKTTQSLAQQEYARRRALLANRTVSQEAVDAAKTRDSETLAELQIAERNLSKARIQAGVGPLGSHPMVQVASARLREAVRHVNKHVIYSPLAGVIAQRYTQVGHVIAAGAPLYNIVEADNQWIEANLKENQLTHLRPGQAVTAKADLYGDEHTFTGRVTTIGAGTGAEFSVLPPQNATGNWIKIVQRVPVRIDLDNEALAQFPLPVGASLTVTIDTRDRDRARAQTIGNRGQVSRNAVFENLDEGIDDIIETVLAQYSSMDHEVPRAGTTANGQ